MNDEGRPQAASEPESDCTRNLRTGGGQNQACPACGSVLVAVGAQDLCGTWTCARLGRPT